MRYISKTRLKEISALKQKKYRDRAKQFIVEGTRSVEAALTANVPIRELLVMEGKSDSAFLQMSVDEKVPVYGLQQKDFERISSVQASQGVLAIAEYDQREFPDFFDCRRVLLLNGIQDPGNVGTIIRSAAWFGVEGVLAGEGSADFYNPKVVRASMGGLWDVMLGTVSSEEEALLGLKRRGFTIYAANLRGISSRDWQPTEPSVLVLGSEAHGIAPDVLKHVDTSIRIAADTDENRSTQGRGVESLNVAMAASILMYEWGR